MKIKEIKSMQDVFKYFGVKSTKKAIESIKDSKLSTDTKKSLSFKIFQGNKETRNNKKAEKVYNEYRTKSRNEKVLTDKLKGKYNISNKRDLKKVSKEDLRKNRLQSEYVTIKEKGKKAYEIKKPDFKIGKHDFISPQYDVYAYVRTKENGKFETKTVPLSHSEFNKMRLQDKFTNIKYLENIAQERKQKYLNLKSKPNIEIMEVLEFKMQEVYE